MSQHNWFGTDFAELMQWPVAPLFSRDCYTPWRGLSRRPSTSHDILTNVSVDNGKYHVVMDVHQFAPHEIVVKTVGDLILVEGKHEEKEDDHGYISRHFVRKYKLPHDHDVDDVVSSLSSDGILSIIAPKKNPEALKGERVVPIHIMGPVCKNIRRDPHSQVHGQEKLHKQDHPINVQHLH